MEKRIKIVDGIDTKELFGSMDINMKLIKEATGVDMADIMQNNSKVIAGEAKIKK